MSFHKRYISNEQVIEMYRREGINKVEEWYTKGVDALITETGLASDVTDILYKDMDNIKKWNLISEMIFEESIKTINEK
tara:strand:- start:258 stop:494 length:237 start_codon:yes stop_codon:yes gene_type:complete